MSSSEKKHKKLRTGFTTGAAAAAAAKAALSCLLGGTCADRVTVRLLTGQDLSIAVESSERLSERQAVARVIKDAGDDPDVTHKALIGAMVNLLGSGRIQGDSIVITGGRGVGRVTKPGLDVKPGEPAVNPGPRRMIRMALNDVRQQYGSNVPVEVEVFVPRGEELAKKTLNARLGILGGISILGTTGIVRPMSHEAYRATIRAALDVARAMGNDVLVFTTGRRSERFSQALWPRLAPEAFVQIGDFFRFSLSAAGERRFSAVTLAVFFGKAVKMAQGVPHTHAAKSRMSLEQLARWTLEETADAQLARKVGAANTARHAFEHLYPGHCQVIDRVGRQVVSAARGFSGEKMDIQCIIFDFDGNVIYSSRERS